MNFASLQQEKKENSSDGHQYTLLMHKARKIAALRHIYEPQYIKFTILLSTDP